jgi:hypothetical protein
MKKRFVVLLVILAASFVALPASTVIAAPPENSNAGGRNFGTLWYDGVQVRTFVPNGKPLKNPGTDPLYAFPNGEQSSITKYAPGDPEYMGGHWAVYFVTWNVAPYLIESYDELMTAWSASDVSIVRMPSADVLCPVMP